MINRNIMSTMKIKSLIWKTGLPMIVSMILQAIYNVIDTIFVINMGENGVLGNEALTYAFPIQILIIAISVGTGIGINAFLSKNLGENNKEIVNRVAGNGIVIGLAIYLIFLIFGLFFSKPYMQMMSDNSLIIKMGSDYLSICCIFSFGAIGFAIYERFLQATGKTLYSTIAQVVGALCNIILDYIFIYPLSLGVKGAALATIIGQCVSLIVAMAFHYLINKEIENNIKYLKPSLKIIKAVYKIGLPAMIMQGLLAVMMFSFIAVIKTIDDKIISSLLVGTFGIYYKIMQLALFALFGLSNTLITITSFSYGMKNIKRLNLLVKHGIIDCIIVALVITIIFQLFAYDIASVFGMSIPDISNNGVEKKKIIDLCTIAIRLSSIGYVFMGVSVGIQGILQGLNNIYRPVIISLLRLIVFVIPIGLLFTQFDNVTYNIWWTFPLAEVLCNIIAILLFVPIIKKVNN